MNDLITIVSIIITIISILFSIHQNEQYFYFFRKKNVVKEKYMVMDIISYPTREEVIDLCILKLVKSSQKSATGFALINLNSEASEIKFESYSFLNNCMHCIIAPSDIIVIRDKYSINTNSNGHSEIKVKVKTEPVDLNLFHKNYIKCKNEVVQIMLSFEFPRNYVGPRYAYKKLIFMKGVGLVGAEVKYSDNRIDQLTLIKHKVKSEKSDAWWPLNEIGNYWEYKIRYSEGHGPNTFNIKSRYQ